MMLTKFPTLGTKTARTPVDFRLVDMTLSHLNLFYLYFNTITIFTCFDHFKVKFSLHTEPIRKSMQSFVAGSEDNKVFNGQLVS